jgi:hypothetical protein
MEHRRTASSTRDETPFGIDRAKLRRALARTPRERLDHAVQAARVAMWLRQARRVDGKQVS